MIGDPVSRSRVGNVIHPEKLRTEPILRITSFIEDMGKSASGVPKEFWWSANSATSATTTCRSRPGSLLCSHQRTNTTPSGSNWATST